VLRNSHADGVQRAAECAVGSLEIRMQAVAEKGGDDASRQLHSLE
jgi:hypothetical protein